MKIEFETRPFVLPGRLLTVTEENAKAAALDWFIQELGHVAVDVPIATDNAGTQAYARYSLRTFLSPSQPEAKVSEYQEDRNLFCCDVSNYCKDFPVGRLIKFLEQHYQRKEP